ncbi:MAG TPA: hypothetical protein VMR97_10705 [Acidimicrobiales bacterium]|nr:hypothetical protein [Acidimicrobiales bacterium]
MIGLLIGEGHFGGDGRAPQVTLRMHVRHERLLRWLDETFPGGRLYGPYHHDGRHYLQWMARGAYLRDRLVPILERCLSPQLDEHSWSRFDRMRRTYSRQLGSQLQDAGALSSPALPDREPERTLERPEGPQGGADLSKKAEEVFERMRRARDGGT